VRLLEKFFKLDSGFWMAFTFQGHLSVSWRWWTLRAPSTSKTTENVETIQELIHEDSQETIHQLADTVGISYEVCQEILTEKLTMHRIPSSSRQRTPPPVPENHRVCD
jgi:hypothetical protein